MNKLWSFIPLWSFLFLGFEAYATTIRFLKEPEISHQVQYTLLDFVDLQGHDESLAKALWDVQVPKDWTQGPKFTLKKTQVLKLVRKYLFKENKAEFLIPEEIRPQKSAEILSQVHLKRVITEVNESRCRSCDFRIQFKNVPQVLLADWRWDPFEGKFRGSFLSAIRVQDQQRSDWLTGFVRWMGPTAKTKISLQSRQKINSAEITWETGDVTELDFPRREDLENKVALRALRAGEVLKHSDLEEEPQVRRGDFVKAIVSNNDFEITLKALAEEVGRNGDQIRIKNLETKKALTATVIGPGAVRVQ